ncbi:MAG: thiol:disulfide interchange protein precursor [Firmicutes bacterium ADurb.Bin182]|nr:MAG: thiol:disulfide interchange protein precursor [Firmicutes bacterium ADurb.Bin182]
MFNELTEALVFVQGLASFLSPCVLPLLPAYLAVLSGSTLDDAVLDKNVHRALVWNAALFILGFTVVFVSLGAGASAIGNFLISFSEPIRIVSGILIILFGLFMLDIIPLSFLQHEKRFEVEKKAGGPLRSFLLGMAFSFGWTPCIGPVLASVLLMASREALLARGMWLLFVYSMGLAVPFMALAVFLRFLMKPLKAMKKHTPLIRRISALLLIFMGILILTDSFTLLSRI